MEAAADVLLGMAAEKIQALVIHLCTSVCAHTRAHSHIHVHSFCVFSLSLSFSDTHTNVHNLSLLSVFHKHPLSFLLTPTLGTLQPPPHLAVHLLYLFYITGSALLTFTAAGAAAMPHGIAGVLCWKQAQRVEGG